ncbi:MAG: aminodeoxychorismate synthase component I [Paludisphaera borealis]|uniref:aminodeoxychorismate synthase component I n=1 Tax=Paludisphaera borealis TaxID=1387353 RepID=UPI00284B1CD1|nr:aminodeoxychorismate synthase component I [Paludisphaera borealis]MDR3618880.1 aminodeoxychorismate synthase component I [Paludisphaera borealis]
MGDPETPTIVKTALDLAADRLAATVGAWPEPAILASGSGFGAAGRWTILAAYPRLVFEAVGDRWSIRNDDGSYETGVDPLAALASLAHRFRLAETDQTPDVDACPFQGGLIGFLGYDLAPSLERLPRKADRDSKLPDVRMALYDTAVVVDHEKDAVVLYAWDLTGEGREATERRARFWRRALRRADESPRPLGASSLGPLTSNFDRDDYLKAVGRALDYIAAGDVFQINLSQRFAATGRVEPLDLFLRLQQESPAPFSAFLRWRNLAVVSASPEWFYQTRGDLITTRPIKGTRPRGATPEADQALAAELSASVKDRAELTMIVDLERNDLGRVCRFGSVHVVDSLVLESYAQVHHLVATVEGRLRPEIGPIDVIRAVFPGGSITGAPKIRAMEIIDELEPTRRSLYTGAIGYLGRGGASGFNIAIRTVLVEGDRVSYQVGGGIVADSDPEAEFEETMHKGKGLRRVLTGKDGPE